VAGVEDAQPVPARLDGDLGVDGAVGQHRVAEELWHHGDGGRRTGGGGPPLALAVGVVLVCVPEAPGIRPAGPRRVHRWAVQAGSTVRMAGAPKILSWTMIGNSRPPASTNSGSPRFLRPISKLSRMSSAVAMPA